MTKYTKLFIQVNIPMMNRFVNDIVVNLKKASLTNWFFAYTIPHNGQQYL